MSITIDGLASGLNTTSIINQLLSIARRPEDLLNARITTAKNQQTALMALSAKLLALRTKAAALSTASTFNAATLTSSNPDALSVSGRVTTEGSYMFQVSQLAQSGQAVTRGYADSDTTHVGAGTLKIALGDIQLDHATPLDVLNGLDGVQRGKIKITNRAGQSTIVDLKIGRYLAKARAPAGFKGDIGEKVAVTINREKIHIFDKKRDQLLV